MKDDERFIIFLDFDGVVNTIYYRQYPRMKHMGNDGYMMYCSMPEDGFVSNRQAIEWLNELYDDHPFDIVVSSTWRRHDRDCGEILYNSGLRRDIQYLGDTPYYPGELRGVEIQSWIDINKYTGEFFILDDDKDMGHLMDKLIHCHCHLGFTVIECMKLSRRVSELKEKGRAK